MKSLMITNYLGIFNTQSIDFVFHATCCKAALENLYLTYRIKTMDKRGNQR